jgi:hypothetical protein
MHPNTILHEVQQLYNVSDRLDFQPGIIVPVPLRQTLSAVTARVKRVNALLSANGVFAPNGTAVRGNFRSERTSIVDSV